MSALKSLVDKALAKKDELEKKAARKAAEKAAELAFERGKQAAQAVVEQAGKSLLGAGAMLEEALFGPDGDAQAKGQGEVAAAKGAEPAGGLASRAAKRPAPAPEPVEDRARFDREVDAELAAMKRKIAGKK
jgi:hypothetical protein